MWKLHASEEERFQVGPRERSPGARAESGETLRKLGATRTVVGRSAPLSRVRGMPKGAPDRLQTASLAVT